MSVCTRVSNFKKYHFKEKTFAKESDTFNELLANKTFLIEISRFIALQKVNWLEKFHCLADKGNVWKKIQIPERFFILQHATSIINL